jgi:ribosomal protein S18 acetylase RimI-like enzyme
MIRGTEQIHYRLSEESDIPAMAQIRAAEWETEEYWKRRISGYLACELHPQKALLPRVSYVALQGDSLVGFVAGHLTRRYGCDGELEWINVTPEHRGTEIASELLRLMAAWFGDHRAPRVCIDVDPSNTVARRFYMRHSAEILNPHWLVWNDISVVVAKK